MNNTIKFLIPKNSNSERLDVYLSKRMENHTRTFIKKLIKQKNVDVNGISNVVPSTKIRENDKIIVKIINKRDKKLVPKKIDLKITAIEPATKSVFNSSLKEFFSLFLNAVISEPPIKKIPVIIILFMHYLHTRSKRNNYKG